VVEMSESRTRLKLEDVPRFEALYSAIQRAYKDVETADTG